MTSLRVRPGPQDTTLRVAVYVAVACSIAGAIYTVTGIEPLPIMSLLVTFGPLVVVILWLQKDARRTRIGAIQDWGFFVWLAWPFLIPWYAFKSRGREGWRLLIGLVALIVAPIATSFALAWVIYGVRLARWYASG